MASPVKVVFLGGLGEIGRNCAAIEVEGKIMLIDCGLMFPDAEMAGVDLVIPDFTYLRENADRVIGVVVTHGHEDHIGALSYLLSEMPLKLIGSAFTLGMAKNRIEERGVMSQAEFVEVEDNERIKVGPFDLEFFPVTHSIPNGFATAFHTPQGVILHSGDFKLDLTPVDGRLTDLPGLGHLARADGVRLFLCDSTNAEAPGFSVSETSIGQSLRALFAAHAERRIIVACFSSHVHRVQQIADAAIAQGRTIATLGRSMNKNVGLARELGLLKIPDSKLCKIEDIEGIPDEELCVISTGSQGEPMSALSRMVTGESKWLTIEKNDTVILSSHPIPGNESRVSWVIGGLLERGAEVVHSGNARVHTTGHGKTDELKILHSVVRPEWFVPVHGEFRQLSAHARIGEEMGTDPEKILVCQDGVTLLLDDKGLRQGAKVPADYIYVDGHVTDLDQSVLADRKILGQDGFVSVILTVSDEDGHAILVEPPAVLSRGWVDGEEGDKLRAKASLEIAEAVSKVLEKGVTDHDEISRVARRTLGRYINHTTRLRPMVVPVVVGVQE